MTTNAATQSRKRDSTLIQRVKQALEGAGVPQAGVGQRGWLAESARGTVRLYWGYGEPPLKSEQAHSALGQCYFLLANAGFTMHDKIFKDRDCHIDVMG